MSAPAIPVEARSLLLRAPEHLAWETRTLPRPGPGEILVESRLGAISLGTELPHYLGKSRDDAPPVYPAMTGYENIAIVRALGPGVSAPALGERIVATYGHRTAAIIPATKAYTIPPDLGDEAALLLILSGDVATGIRKLGAPPPGPILITGAGVIGLLAVFVLKALGATAIDLVEPLAERRALALTFGARRAVAPGEAAALAGDYACGVECSSRDAAFALLQRQLRPYGRICVLSDGNLEPLTLAPEFHRRQLAVVGSSDCPDYREHGRWFFPLARRHEIQLARLFDQTIRADELPATFAALADGTLAATKVLVRYGDPARPG